MNQQIINSTFIKGIFIFLLTFIVFQNRSFAQDNWEGTGEIEEAEVIIEKNRNIVLPNALRIFERVPDFSQPTGILGLSYTFEPISFKPIAIVSRVRPLTIKTERLPSLKNNNIKVGYGNYITPFLEANFGNGRNDQYLYNLFLHHRSSSKGPVDAENSGDSESMIDFNGKVFLNKATLAGQLAYERDGFTFYGYDNTQEPLKEDIKQVLHQVTVTGSIENNLPDSKAKYSLKGTLDYIQDNYSASEADFGMRLYGRVPINDNYNIDIKSDFNMMSRKDSLLPSFNRLFLRIKPYVNYTQDNLEINFGLSTVLEDDTLGGSKDFHIFPYLDINYDVSASARVYAGYRGDMDKISLKDNLRNNRYLAPNVDVFNRNRTFDFYVGLKGTLANNLSFDAGADLTYYKNQGYYVNSTADSTKFDIIYDTGTGNSNHLYASLGYTIKDKILLGVQEHHYFYNTENTAEAWHLPTNKLVLISSIYVGQKLKFNADLYMLSGMIARDPSSGTAISLDSIIDIDLGLEYLLSNQASIFVNTYNILGKEYVRYLNYPNRGLQVIAGLSYSF